MYEWKSEQIDQIAAALAAAQKVMQPAIKDRTNPAFKSKYADLAGVWEAMGDALQTNGLALVQLPFPADGGFILRTVLTHKSGQWLLSDLFMAPDMTNAQKVGGAITYARRYAASAMVGVYQDDDDGETAIGRGNGHAYQGNGYGRPAPALPVSPRGDIPPADDRPFPEFLAAAAKAAGVAESAIVNDVLADLTEQGKTGAELRDDGQKRQAVAEWYRRDRAAIQATVKALVKHYRAAVSA